MTTQTLTELRKQRSLVTLANANELASRIIRQVVGNDIASSFNGSPLTSSLICTIVQHRFQTALDKTPVRTN